MLALFTYGSIFAQSFATPIEKGSPDQFLVYYDQWYPMFRETGGAEYGSGADCLTKCINDEDCVGVQLNSNMQWQCYSFSERPPVVGRGEVLGKDITLGVEGPQPKFSVFLKNGRDRWSNWCDGYRCD